MAEKVSRDRGYRSDSIAISRDMGPLSPEILLAKTAFSLRFYSVRNFENSEVYWQGSFTLHLRLTMTAPGLRL